jgi:hypothetical protein
VGKTKLFDPARHEPLTQTGWDEARARSALAADTEAAYDPRGFWPSHPLDGRTPSTTLYNGATGVVWAIDWLRAEGAAEPTRDYADLALALVARNRVELGGDVPSLLIGQLGALLVARRVAGASLTDELLGAIADGIERPENEYMWGAPGALVVARHLAQAENDGRFDALARRAADHILETWREDAASDAALWVQDLYGRRSRYLGAAHGAAGNLFALACSADQDEARRHSLWDAPRVCSPTQRNWRRALRTGQQSRAVRF